MYELLLEGEFTKDFLERLRLARSRIYLQMMTFEADASGKQVFGLLLKAKKRGVDVRIIVDKYTDMMVSNMPAKHPSVREEAILTAYAFAMLKKAGIPVVRTRPLGPLQAYILFRNHKKLFIIDDMSYIGGMNISDHNFAWHDFMVRIDDPTRTAVLVKDFLQTEKGEVSDLKKKGILTNRHIRDSFLRLLRTARKEVIISSPYVLDPFLFNVIQKVRPGVRVLLLTLGKNNVGIINTMSPYVVRRLINAGVLVREYGRFSHAKFVMVDRKCMLVGSSNFGMESVLCKDEIGLLIKDSVFVENAYLRLVEAEKTSPAVMPERADILLSSALVGFLVKQSLPVYGSVLKRHVPVLCSP
ncbi:MAG: phosphatidylserine/phosphatidylglycerophosphate/cardiolipin synthase family protein [Nanoarchaeota archaeon]